MFSAMLGKMKSGLVLFLLLLWLLAGVTGRDVLEDSGMVSAATGDIDVVLVPIATGFSNPVDIVHAGDGRLFIVEQAGRIRIVETDGTVAEMPFLNISGRVTAGGERGLLGLVFHPEYASNGYFFVNYTHRNQHYDDNKLYTRIARFQVSAGATVADPDSEFVILEIDQPFDNHNAGDLSFGPDGYLYIPTGDGGSGGDPGNRAQNRAVLLGKMLRIDVNAEAGNLPDCSSDGNYSIPADNPFVDGPGGVCDEIWALGLRNPWRFSFDRATGDMYVADVGQQDWEEVNFQPAASPGGENYGWRCYEGNHNFNLDGCQPREVYTFPIHEYENDAENCAITGGFVYRGEQYPMLVGHYIFADYCSRQLWSLARVENEWHLSTLGRVPDSPSSFGQAANGELYVAGHLNGVIYHIQETSFAEKFFLPVIFNDDNN